MKIESSRQVWTERTDERTNERTLAFTGLRQSQKSPKISRKKFSAQLFWHKHIIHKTYWINWQTRCDTPNLMQGVRSGGLWQSFRSWRNGVRTKTGLWLVQSDDGDNVPGPKTWINICDGWPRPVNISATLLQLIICNNAINNAINKIMWLNQTRKQNRSNWFYKK